MFTSYSRLYVLNYSKREVIDLKFCNPNLPAPNVDEMLVSELVPENIIDELISFGVTPVKSGRCSRIPSELSFHPDMLTFNYAPGKWLVEQNNSYLPINMNILLTYSKYHLGSKYPADCIYNSFSIFCGFVNIGVYENIDELKGFELISFKQGYAKCSVIPLNERSFITSDKSIEKKLSELQYDCLYVSSECVELNGFTNGFIGGCAGKVSENLLVFTGSIEKHNDYKNIRDFCKNHGIELYSLSNDPLYDYGGLLPITEKGTF